MSEEVNAMRHLVRAYLKSDGDVAERVKCLTSYCIAREVFSEEDLKEISSHNVFKDLLSMYNSEMSIIRYVFERSAEDASILMGAWLAGSDVNKVACVHILRSMSQ